MFSTNSIFWDQILFSIFSTVFLMVNIINTRDSQHQTKVESSKSEEEKRVVKYWKHIKVLLSFYAMFLSPILFLGFTSETYLVGSQLLINLVSAAIGYIIAFTFILPVIFGLDKSIKTPYEYFERRFDGNKAPRIVSALSAALFYFSLSALFLFGAALILTSFLPLPIWIATLLIGLYSTSAILTKHNCFKFAFWTSLGQFAVFLTGIALAIVITIFFTPNRSASEMMRLADSKGRWNIIILDVNPTIKYTVWNQLFSLPLPWSVIHCLTATTFTKYRSFKSKTHAGLILVLNIPFMLLVNASFWFSGICAFLFFYGCDPVYSGQLMNKNQVSTKWFIDSITTHFRGLSGISLSCLFSFSIYQLSLSLSACSKTLLNDVLLNKCVEKYGTKVKKILYFILVGLSSVFSFFLSYSKGSILSLFFFFNKTFNSPILGLFLLAVINPYANSFGAVLSFVLCILFEIYCSTLTFYSSALKHAETKPNLDNCSHYSFNETVNQSNTKDSILIYLVSISSLWFCLASVVFIIVFGSLFSVLYSLVRYGEFAHYSEIRKDYLFSFKLVRFNRNKNK